MILMQFRSVEIFFENFELREKQKLEVKDIEEPLYDPEELYGIAPVDLRKIG